MGLTGLGVASVRALIGDGQWQQFISYFIYPLGFIAVIIGRAQLFTENTLYPVMLVLDERRHFTQIFRLGGNRIHLERGGAFLFALLAIKSAALRPEIAAQLVKLGLDSMHGGGAYFFWSGVIGGWLIALVAWVVLRESLDNRASCDAVVAGIRGGRG
jgi:formate-nitrite transporter family protein